MARTIRCFECGNFRPVGKLFVCLNHYSKIDGRQIDAHVCTGCEITHRARHVKGDFK